MSAADSALRFLTQDVVDFGGGLSFIIKLLICLDEDAADISSSAKGSASGSPAGGGPSCRDEDAVSSSAASACWSPADGGSSCRDTKKITKQ